MHDDVQMLAYFTSAYTFSSPSSSSSPSVSFLTLNPSSGLVSGSSFAGCQRPESTQRFMWYLASSSDIFLMVSWSLAMSWDSKHSFNACQKKVLKTKCAQKSECKMSSHRVGIQTLLQDLILRVQDVPDDPFLLLSQHQQFARQSFLWLCSWYELWKLPIHHRKLSCILDRRFESWKNSVKHCS